jgi:hypothetical protein
MPAFAGTASGGTPVPPGLDHFLCYRSRALTTDTWETFAKNVTLKDQFESVRVKLGRLPNRLCNPVLKIVNGAEYPPQNPNAHLVCWPMTEPATLKREVIVTNQFGQARLTVGQPNALCLPSWKSVTDQLPDPPAPPGLDHFKCYPAEYSTGVVQHFNIPKQVQLIDQFQNYTTKVRLPVELCNPVKKILRGGHEFPPTNPDAHLVCFGLPKPPPGTPAHHVWEKNQFGTGQSDVTEAQRLCLPSYKQLITPGA